MISIGRRCSNAVVYVNKRLQSTCNSNNEHIRKAQASEIFRYAYYQVSKSTNNTISVSDLDDLVAENSVRPSILLGGYELLGSSLGLLSKLAPKQCTKIIDNIIEDVTTQQFNDSLRSIGNDDNDNSNSNKSDDIKLTLKIHRDFNSNNGSNSNNNDSNNNGKILTGALYHVLKFSQYT